MKGMMIMAKSPNQKLKLLYITKILMKYTDEEHPITTNNLIDALKDVGIQAERKSIYDDIECLKTFGIDIETKRKPTQAYYVASGTFQLPELKILADSVSASRFITKKKSGELIKKIGTLTSVHQSARIERQVYVSNRTKTTNETIYYTVDKIHRAIAERRKIHFQYFDYDEKKQKKFHHDGMVYTVSPFALMYNNENYYLVGKCDQHEHEVSHFRADKMFRVSISETPSEDCTVNMTDYTSKVFSMFGGEELEIKLRCENQLAGVMIDRFGKDISFIIDDEKHFVIHISAEISPAFWGWIFQFGNQIKILEPQSLVEDYQQYLEKVYNQYD